MCPVARCRRGLRRDPSGSALPIIPQSVSRGTRFSRLHWFAFATACQVARPPGRIGPSFPGPPGTFTSRLPAGRSPFPPLDRTTTATGLLCWRDFHPQEWQLASLHRTWPRSPPTSFLRPVWREAVLDSGSKGVTGHRRVWEAATLLALRERLRAGDIWGAGRRQWRAVEDHLIPPALFTAMREAGPLPVAVPATAAEYLAGRRALLERRMGEINAKAEADALEDVRIKGDELKITPLKAITPEAAEK